MDSNNFNHKQHSSHTPSLETIERYVNHQLSPEELDKFEQFLQDAPQDFQDLVEGMQLQKMAKEMQKKPEYQSLKQDFQPERIMSNLPPELLTKSQTH